MATRTQNRSTVDMPDAADLIDCYECELDDGTGGHHVHQWEVVTRVHYDVNDSGDAENVDQDWEVLWWNCECGHQTYP